MIMFGVLLTLSVRLCHRVQVLHERDQAATERPPRLDRVCHWRRDGHGSQTDLGSCERDQVKYTGTSVTVISIDDSKFTYFGA